jgi:hypothetical protein
MAVGCAPRSLIKSAAEKTKELAVLTTDVGDGVAW